MRRVIGAFGLAFGLWVGIAMVGSQSIPKSLQEGGPEEVLKQRQNNWTVGIAGGNMDGTYLRFADELGKVLDDGDALRVLPTISRGPTWKTYSTFAASMSRSPSRHTLPSSLSHPFGGGTPLNCNYSKTRRAII